MICEICKKPLNRTEWSADGTLKSCPNCSAHSKKKQHVYYHYPEKFGTTPMRSTPKHPEGPQSYCSSCRAEDIPDLSQAIYCEAVDIKK